MSISIEISVITAGENPNSSNLTDDLHWWCFGNGGVGAFVQAYHEGMEIGHATVVEKPTLRGAKVFRVAEIGHNYVEKDFRRKGVFSKLLESIERYARLEGVSALYVTPNRESEPLYRKQDYVFCEVSPELMLVPLDSAEVNRMGKPLIEIQLDTYIDMTLNCQRLVDGCKRYLQWRFSRPTAHYRFFCSQDETAMLAVRRGRPGPISVYVLSECFLDGQKPQLGTIEQYAKQLRHYLFEQIPIIFPLARGCGSEDSRMFHLYRNFPIAFKTLDNEGFIFPSTHQYQFTDSDYG